MPTLTKETLKLETLQLFRDYQRSRDPDLRNQIVELNFGLVRREACHWNSRCPESYEDLLQIGCLGLIRAIERFSADRGHAFSSFALPYIRGEIQHYLRDKSHPIRIPRRWLELGRQALAWQQDFREQFNRPPTDLEIARALDIALTEWQDVKLAYHNRQLLSLDALLTGSEGEGKTSMGDVLPDPQYRSFQLAQEDQLRLQQALAQLEERTRRILEFVFLRDLTQKETAEQLGISVVTVSRRVKKGLERLKQLMKAEIF